MTIPPPWLGVAGSRSVDKGGAITGTGTFFFSFRSGPPWDYLSQMVTAAYACVPALGAAFSITIADSEIMPWAPPRPPRRPPRLSTGRLPPGRGAGVHAGLA